MATSPNTPSGMNTGAVPQHKRMAMGYPVSGKDLPPAPPAGKTTPA